MLLLDKSHDVCKIVAMRRSLFASLFVLVTLGCSASKDDTANPGKLDGSLGDVALGDDGLPVDVGTGFEIGGDGTTIVDAPADGIASPMRITPGDLVTMLVGGKPTTTEYFLELLNADGTTTDITAEAGWSLLDPSIGTFAGNKLTAAKVGKTMVRASARGLTVETSVDVRNPVTIVTPGTAADAPTKFGGTVDPARAPSFVYPANNTVVPPNMNVLELHFMPNGNSLFELAFVGGGIDLKVYLGCTAVGGGCVYTPDATVWKLVAENGRGKDPVTYTLRGVDGAAPGKVGVSASQKISFGQEDILGGIYYWNAGAGATMRYEFGVSGKAGEVYLNAPLAGAGTCVGCHVLSRTGKRISVGLDIPSPSPYKVFDVATRALVYAQGSTFGGGGSNFFSFSPDGSQIVTSNGITTALRDAKTGAAIVDPLVNPGAQPDWSPDGKTIVYAKPSSAPPCLPPFCGATGVDSSSLETLTLSGSKWGPGKTLVPFGGQNNFYPAFSPDGTWVAFNRSPGNTNSYDSKDALVYLVAGAGGTPVKLANASTGGDSWPKWTPVVQKYKSGQLLWLTFSSRRAYGLRSADGKTAQIWMTAIDPSKASSGVDPSAPAFWLPFQDLASGNHIAQWVTKVERKPCSSPAECLTGEQCVGGVCRPVIK
ncbi:MAG: PD40 domain-containing protein [Myxococcales bacterium]|nr:PD40 domain-containing protein [Myxococcales bacterium]